MITELSEIITATALPDCLTFERSLVESLIETHRRGSVLGVLLVRLDRNNPVNGTLGRSFGDMLYAELAYRFSSCLRAGDAVARVSSEEFAFIFPEIGQAGDEQLEIMRRVNGMARRILDGFIAPFGIGGNDYYLSASGGISLYPFDGCSAHVLLKNVSAAAERASELGGNRYQLYTDEIDAEGQRRLELESGLRRALDQGELVVHYQPKVSASTGALVGAEALVRWQHPERGLLPPSEFVPFAEETGLIAPLSVWVLRVVCAQAVEWLGAGLNPGRISVNLSPRHFQHPELIAQVQGALGSTGLDPQHLELEVTEGSIMRDAEHAASKLRVFRGMGITVSVDDFGTGYSSLGYLRLLPLDALKIDRAFISDVVENADNRAIVEAVVGLGHALRLKVVAEGVETEEQAALLRELRCDEFQGYLFGRPQPASDFRLRLPRTN